MATAKIDIKTDIHGSDKELNKVDKSIKEIKDNAKKGDTATKNLWKQFAAGVLAAGLLNKVLSGVKGLAKSFLDVSIQVETYEIRLETLLGSQDKATKALDFFKDVAAKLPFTLEDVIEAGTRLAAIRAPFEKWLPRIADLAAAIGFDLPTATDQMARAMASGLGSADLFREKGVSAMVKDFAKLKLGIDDISKISLPELNDVLFEFTGEFSGASEKMAGTWVGLTSMLEDSWFQFRDAVMESGVFEILKDSISDLNDEVIAFRDKGGFEKIGGGLSGFLDIMKEGNKVWDFFTDKTGLASIAMGDATYEMFLGKAEAFLWAKDIVDAGDAAQQLDNKTEMLEEQLALMRGEITEDELKFGIITDTIEDKLDPAIFDATGKVKLLKDEFEKAKTPADLLAIAVSGFRDELDQSLTIIDDTTEGVKLLTFEMSDFPIELDHVPGTIEGILESVDFNAWADDAIEASEGMSVALTEQELLALEAIEEQAEKTMIIIEGFAIDIGNAFGQLFLDIVDESSTFEEAMFILWDNIKQAFLDVIADMIAEWVTGFVEQAIMDMGILEGAFEGLGGTAKTAGDEIATAGIAAEIAGGKAGASASGWGLIAAWVLIIANGFLSMKDNLNENWEAERQILDDKIEKWRELGFTILEVADAVRDYTDAVNDSIAAELGIPTTGRGGTDTARDLRRDPIIDFGGRPGGVLDTTPAVVVDEGGGVDEASIQEVAPVQINLQIDGTTLAQALVKPLSEESRLGTFLTEQQNIMRSET